MRQRNPVFDIMKGIGIVLVLIGHMPPSDEVYHLIYTFHLPMFFILAGLFAKDCYDVPSIKENIGKSAKRLLLPIVITSLFIVILSPLKYYQLKNWDGAVNGLLSLLWGGGDQLKTRWGNLGIGPMWFIMALFWARCLLSFIVFIFHKVSGFWERLKVYNKGCVLIVCVMVSWVAVLIHDQSWSLWPWSIMQGVSALQFMAIGWYIKHKKINVWIKLLVVMFWPLAYVWGGIEMCDCYYKCYLLDVFGACGATYCVYIVSVGLSKVKFASKLFQWFGTNSLAILCIHTLDRKTYLARAIKGLLGIGIDGMMNYLYHMFLTLFIVLIFSLIPRLGKIYGTKRMKYITA